MQYALPRAQLAVLARCLEDLSGELSGRVVELKFVGGPGTSLLGVNADGPVVCANVLWQLGPREAPDLVAFERALVAIGGRPHLGKLHRHVDMRPGDGSSWPQGATFASLVATADPDGRLSASDVRQSLCGAPAACLA